MPIIKSKPKIEKEQLRINIDKQLYETIKKYCSWANVEKMDDFFEQAISFVFDKDKDWQKHIESTE